MIIQLPKNKIVNVSNIDYRYLESFKWTIYENYNTFYAYRVDNQKKIYMHDEVIKRAGIVVSKNTSKLFIIKHIDENGLNNQRSNLKITYNGTLEIYVTSKYIQLVHDTEKYLIIKKYSILKNK